MFINMNSQFVASSLQPIAIYYRMSFSFHRRAFEIPACCSLFTAQFPAFTTLSKCFLMADTKGIRTNSSKSSMNLSCCLSNYFCHVIGLTLSDQVTLLLLSLSFKGLTTSRKIKALLASFQMHYGNISILQYCMCYMVSTSLTHQSAFGLNARNNFTITVNLS